MILDYLKHKISDLFNWHAGPPPFPENTDGFKKSVTADEALRIFDHLASNEEIAFRYGYDGCYARAHLMVRELFDMGIVPKKAWAQEGDDRLLVVRLGHQKIDWVFHVAPVVTVEMPDGRKQDMVFDPSLFDGPVTLAQWGKVMHARRGQLEIKPVGQGAFGAYGDYTPDERTTSKTDKYARQTMRDYLPLQEPAGSVKLFHSDFGATIYTTVKPRRPLQWQPQAA